MTDINAIWRAIVDAAAAVLPEREARQLAEDALARLSAEMSCRTVSAREKVDVFIAAFNALHVSSADIKCIDMVDRDDHLLIINVPTAAEVDALAAELDLEEPADRIDSGCRWREASVNPDRGTTIFVQGAHRPSRSTAA